MRALCAALLVLGVGPAADGAVIEVASPAESIQAAIDAAQGGDTIRVGPGLYLENLDLDGKSVSLESHFVSSGDPALIDQTVIDASGTGSGILVRASAGTGTRIIGFTIRNANDGVRAFAPIEFRHNRVTNTVDGIDFENGSGGIVADSTFDGNADDALDLDNIVDVVIENNELIDNGDDGIEIRLHDTPGYSGPTIEIVIRDNRITGNGEDGIQLIDDQTLTDRHITIQGNLIEGNAFAGVGMMCCQDTVEDFQGAAVDETVFLIHNTIQGNHHGVSGGARLFAVNNLFVGNTQIGLKNATGDSIAAYGLFFANGIDHQGSNVEVATTLFADPLLEPDFELASGSPAIDAGTDFYESGGETVLDLPPSAYLGAAPDLGAFEAAPPIPALGRNGAVLAGGLLAGLAFVALRSAAQRRASAAAPGAAR